MEKTFFNFAFFLGNKTKNHLDFHIYMYICMCFEFVKAVQAVQAADENVEVEIKTK